MQEGEQYFVNRITFLGNTTTHDNVIRREMQLVESGVFNTEALKHSVKHLNQLGYFKPLEGRRERQGREDAGREEQGRRHAEARGAEPQPADVRRRRVAVRGRLRAVRVPDRRTSSARARRCRCRCWPASATRTTSSSFSEPYLFDRPITGGINIFNRTINYIGAFTQESSGGNVMAGFPVWPSFSRAFMSYSYERVGISDLNAIYTRIPTIAGRNPFLKDALLLERRRQAHDQQGLAELRPQHGRQPDLPERRASASPLGFDLAGLGGNTSFYKPRARRRSSTSSRRAGLSVGVRAQFEFVAPYRGTHVAADLRAAGAGRRVQHPRLRHPHHRPARRPGHRAGHRRQQEPAVQRRVH